jgi:glycosyltransferase involved in cell wall biosynthesis
MTIGFLLNTCEPFYRGGYERRAWSFARELARQGHEVRIYTSCPRNEIIEGVQFVRLGPPRLFFNAKGVRNGSADLLFAAAVGKLLWRLKRRELGVLDVCATPFIHLPVVALVGWLKRIPVVLTCHEALLAQLPAYARERGHRGRFGGWLTTRVLALVYRLGMGLFSRRLAVSHRTAEALAGENFPARATVEFGLEVEAIIPVFPEPVSWENAVGLIFCGRLTPIKSVDQTLAALFSLRRQSGPFHFHVVGEGGERARLQGLVAAAHADDYVTFHGELSEEDKRALLARSEVFVLSSPREGFSIATLEAMAQGCAALVVSDPDRPNGALDFVRSGREGLSVAPGLGTMREALRQLIENHEQRRAFRGAAWQTAQTYRIDRQAERLLAVYGEATAATL